MKKLVVLGVTSALLVGFAIASGSIERFTAQIGSIFGIDRSQTARRPKTGSRADDLAGAMEFEFNMTKDPATGRIPEGIREAELAQANEIVRQQKGRSAPEFASYGFQGPDNLGGRTRALAYDVRNGTSNGVIMAGGISGGIFKSTDDGATWVRKSPIGDLFNVSALAQDTRPGGAPAFRDTWYYAGGEFSGNSTSATGASYRGKGVYKSIDNGETWTFLPASNTGGLEAFDHRADYVVKLAVHPMTGDVYMAAMDAIYRSTDGGGSWGIVLTSGSAGFSTGMATDIAITPSGSFYAAFSGTSNTLPVDMPGVWRSPTGAPGSWTKIAGAGAGPSPPGWNPDGTYGRVVLAIAPSLESKVYALYWNGTTFGCGAPAPEAEFYYWDDGSSTWTDVSATLPNEPGCLAGNDPFAVQTGYDLAVAVKPDAHGTVFIGGTNAYRSTDSGATWTRIGGYASPATYALYASSHPDVHAFAFKPTSSTTMLCGNDGGIQRTTDNTAGTVAWSQINTGYRTYQYYYVANDPRSGNSKVIGGAQDNGTTRNVGGTGSTFEPVYGGDGVSVGLTDPAVTGGVQYEYVGSQLGDIERRPSTDPAGFATDIKPSTAGSGLFVTLFKLDPDNSETLYYANGASLYRTTSASTVAPGTWTNMTGISTAVGGASITAIGLSRGAYSAATSSLFFGTSDGRVFRLDDPTGVAAGTAPVNITDAGFPGGAYVSSIAVGPTTDDNVLVTFSNYGVSSIWATSTANSLVAPTWSAVEGNISVPSIRSSAIVLNGAALNYYVGTSVGLYSTATLAGAGTTWAQEGPTSIGNAPATSLDLRPSDNKLLVGTHGYGMWSNLAPTAANVSVSGRVLTALGEGVRNARVVMTDSRGGSRTALTSSFGYYRFDDVPSGETYVMSVVSKRYQFVPRTISVADELTDVDFIADPGKAKADRQSPKLGDARARFR